MFIEGVVVPVKQSKTKQQEQKQNKTKKNTLQLCCFAEITCAHAFRLVNSFILFEQIQFAIRQLIPICHKIKLPFPCILGLAIIDVRQRMCNVLPLNMKGWNIEERITVTA